MTVSGAAIGLVCDSASSGSWTFSALLFDPNSVMGGGGPPTESEARAWFVLRLLGPEKGRGTR